MAHVLSGSAEDRSPGQATAAARARAIPAKFQPRLPLGTILVQNGLITRDQLSQALSHQSHWGSRLGDIVLALGWVKPLAFYRALAGQLRLEFVNLTDQPPDDSLFDPARYQDYAKHLYVPWRRRHGKLWIATADPDSRELATACAGQDVGLVVTSKFDVIWEVQRVARSAFSEDAVYHLSTFDPAHSARIVVTRAQKISFVAGFVLVAAALWFAPIVTLVVLNSTVNSFLFLSFVFRTVLCWMSCAEEDPAISLSEIQQLHDVELPVYTVLVPMYREPTVLPILAAALRNLDYPRSKLDIKLVLEEDDQETIEAAKALALDSTFEIVRVPASQPKTKPKACNYALRFARGQYLTIYDAEDQPQPDQLKKALAGFRKFGPRAACLQARLNFFNAGENWLTRMFALEYSLWFDMFLPALDRLRVPIPLGGTSNHFDIVKLREVGGWDPFNVTEDADLGLRFASCGYHVGVIDSVTYEEANSQAGNWIRQRSRWIKGYMQTWLVNMRHPVALCRRVGWKGFLTLQLFIGGGVISALSYPFLALAFLYWLITRGEALRPFFPPAVLLVSVLNLIMGNSCLVYLSMLAVAKRRHFDLLPHALTVPAYWLLLSVAAYKGLWQLIHNPFFWEKTTHGISKFTNDQLDRASNAA
jgi:glycosyltransferase XagB